MNEQNEKRMAGDYTIIKSLHIGDREVVIGEWQDAPEGEQYMCAFCQRDGILALHTQVIASGDYSEIVKLFGQRIMEQAQKAREEASKPKEQGIDDAPLTVKDCRPVTHDDELENQLIVIRADVLRREYRHATHQIKLCIGGFGAFPNSRGTACYCVNLYTGETSRYERQDVLGILESEQLPEWARRGLAAYRREQEAEKAKHSKDKGAR